MADAVKIRLMKGTFHGVEVEDTAGEILWVHKNMYGYPTVSNGL